MKFNWMKKSGLTGGLCALAMLGGRVSAEEPSANIVRCEASLDQSVLSSQRSNRTILKVTLDAPHAPKKNERPAINLCIVLDKSGSMRGAKMEQAKRAAIEAVQRLDERDIFSLVVYNESVQTVIPATSMRDPQAIIQKINALGSGGNTAIFGGVSQGASEVRKNLEGHFVHRMILLSDGLANVGPSSPEDLGRLGASLMKEKITVTTVGLGQDYNEDLMTALAGKSDGNSYYVAESNDLPRIFAEELGDVLSVVATRVLIEIKIPQGARPLRIIGREGRIKDNVVELEMNQLYGGQQKYVLVEIEVEPRQETASQVIAEALCSYENLLTHANEIQSDEVRATFSNDEATLVASQNLEVQKDVIQQLAVENRLQAVQQWEAGRVVEARQTLEKNAGLYDKFGTDNNSADYKNLAKQEWEYLEKLDEEGLTKANRKVMQTRNFQDSNQQRAR